MRNILKYSGVLLSLYAGVVQAEVKDDETVILFPTSGHISRHNQWIIPLHGWLYEYDADSLWREAGVLALRKSLQLNNIEMDNELFRQRAWMFLVDNKRGRKIQITLLGKSFECQRSKPNGHFIGEATISTIDVSPAQQPIWVSYEVVINNSDKRRFSGESQLLSRQGLSVISDIDDTIKDSHVTDKSELLKSTFLQEFRAVDGMAKVYSQWQADGAALHYLSASPWQLFPPLAAFVRDNGFPKGDFYLRQFRIKDRSFYSLFESPYEYKTKIISQILHNFPERKFVLVGDNTESDPQAYASIAKRFPKNIVKILIRNATGHIDRVKIDTAFGGVDPGLWMVFNNAEELSRLRFDIGAN